MSLPRLKSNFIHLTVGTLVFIVCTMTRPFLVEGKLYSCVDPSGSTIFTDSPSQLENCTPLRMEGPHQSLGTATSVSSGVGEASSSMKKMTPIPSVSQDQSPGQPSSTQLQEDASSSEEQACHSSINPLNPFLNRPCAPKGD